MLKYYEFVENVWPANLVFVIYFSTQCVETVKQLDNDRYFQLTRWSRANATSLDGPGFESRLWEGFFMLEYVCVCVCCCCCYCCYCCCCCCCCCCQLSRNFVINFAMLIRLVYLTFRNVYDRLQGYQDTDLASLSYICFIIGCFFTWKQVRY